MTEMTNARAQAAVNVVSTPDGTPTMLKLRVTVPSDWSEGRRVLLQILNGFEDNVNRLGPCFDRYRAVTGNLDTGQVVRVGDQTPRVLTASVHDSAREGGSADADTSAEAAVLERALESALGKNWRAVVGVEPELSPNIVRWECDGPEGPGRFLRWWRGIWKR